MNKLKIYLAILFLYGGIEFYAYWASGNIEQNFNSFLTADVDESFTEDGLYVAKGFLTAEKYATIPDVINENQKLLAIDVRVEVFQKVEVKNEEGQHHPTYHYEDKWVEENDFEWERSKEWYQEEFTNPNYKSWPIPISTQFIKAEGFKFKNNYDLNDEVMEHYFEFGGDRTNSAMFRDIDFEIPNYLNKKIDTLRDGYYFGNNSKFGKAEIGDVKITLRAFCSEMKTGEIAESIIYNLFGIFDSTNDFLPYEGHYYVESNKSFDRYEEEIVQYEMNGETFYTLFARICIVIITIVFGYQFIKNR